MFNRVIAPYLHCKKEKTLFDHLILETHDMKVLHRNIASGAFQELNALEQILLMEQLILTEKKENIENMKKDGYQKKDKDISIAKNLCREFLRMIQQRIDASPSDLEKETRLFEIALKSGLEREQEIIDTKQSQMDQERQLKKQELLSEGGRSIESYKTRNQKKKLSSSIEMKQQDHDSKIEQLLSDSEIFGESYQYEYPPPNIPHFHQVDNTKEYRENQYYEYNLHNQETKELIPWNQFWIDYAEYILRPLIDENKQQQLSNKLPFISSNIIHAHSSFTEVVMAIGLSDVSLTHIEQQLKYERKEDHNYGIIECEQSACIVFIKETEEAIMNERQTNV
ncbi:MAG: hypothetical protein EZS28_047573, partial [Streblomastix strix]